MGWLAVLFIPLYWYSGLVKALQEALKYYRSLYRYSRRKTTLYLQKKFGEK